MKTNQCRNEDDCPTPMWCRGKDKCPRAKEPRKIGWLARLVRRWRNYRCRRGHHMMRSIPTGLKRLPWFVGECIHCGSIHDGVVTPFGGVIIGEWPSFEDFIHSQNAKCAAAGSERNDHD